MHASLAGSGGGTAGAAGGALVASSPGGDGAPRVPGSELKLGTADGSLNEHAEVRDGRYELRAVPGEDVIALLVQGQVAMPGSFQELTRSMGLHQRAQSSRNGVWTFQRVPAGPHTAFVFRVNEKGVGVHREELAVPEEGELSRELVPSWQAVDFAVAEEDGEP